MTDPADATLAAYQNRAQEYLRGSARPAPELIAYLGRFARLTRPGPVLEIGSGPGWDAGYLEGHGVQVIRTDATPAFVSLLRAAGHHARLLDARTDPLGGPYQGILANAVLHHLNRDQFEDVLRRARTAVTASGVLGFTVKEGDGAAWSEHKLGLPRHFTYWRAGGAHRTAPRRLAGHLHKSCDQPGQLALRPGPHQHRRAARYKHPGQVPLTEPPAVNPRTMTITKSGWSTRARKTPGRQRRTSTRTAERPGRPTRLGSRSWAFGRLNTMAA